MLILQIIGLHTLLIDTRLNFTIRSLWCHSFDFKNVTLLMQMKMSTFIIQDKRRRDFFLLKPSDHYPDGSQVPQSYSLAGSTKLSKVSWYICLDFAALLLQEKHWNGHCPLFAYGVLSNKLNSEQTKKHIRWGPTISIVFTGLNCFILVHYIVWNTLVDALI